MENTMTGEFVISKVFGHTRVLAALILGLASVTVFAQDTSEQDDDGVSDGRIEEVVVTAQKRAESLQVVPIAVTAFNNASLEAFQAYDVTDLATRAPSLVYQQSTTVNQELSIRGIGTIGEFGGSVDPSVATFQDEIYIGRMGVAHTDYFDLARIEVLRGPQGTLFGKNVVGGAISIHTARPEHENSAKMRVGYGNYQSFLFSGHVTGSLDEGVAGRLSVHYRDRGEGFGYNAYRNEEIETLSAYAIRGQLLFDGRDDMTLILRADASHDEGDGKGRRAFDNPFLPGTGPVSGWYPDDDVRKIYNVNEQGHDRDVMGLSATLDWDLGLGTFTSITAYHAADALNVLDQFSAPQPPALAASYLVFDESYEAFSQELRLASNSGDKLDWIGGLYYLSERTTNDDDNFSGPFWLGGPAVNYHYINNNHTTNYGVFGQATWHITDTVGLTVGARYTVDNKDYNTTAEAVRIGGGIPRATILVPYPTQYMSEDWSKMTPKVSFEWQAADDVFLYMSANNGFKGGGWQGKPASAASANVSFNPEYAWSYEIGAKTEWLENRLRANVAAFMVDYKDLQVRSVNADCVCIVVSNAGDAEIKGLEMELQAVLTENFDLWFNGSYLDTEYLNYVDSLGIVFSGNTMQRVPEFSYSVGGEWTIPQLGPWDLSIRADYRWQDEIFWSVENTNYEDDFGLVGGRISYSSPDGRYIVSLWGKNLSDEIYRERVSALFGDEYSTMGPPRFYGAEFTMLFDF
jgi:iron complex outermembrane receptor protein